MSFEKCPICGEYSFNLSHHKCDPRWTVRVVVADAAELDKENWYEESEVYARDPEVAARKAVSDYEAGGDTDYEVSHGSATAYVRVFLDAEGEQWQDYCVTGYMNPVYEATKI